VSVESKMWRRYEENEAEHSTTQHNNTALCA